MMCLLACLLAFNRILEEKIKSKVLEALEQRLNRLGVGIKAFRSSRAQNY